MAERWTGGTATKDWGDQVVTALYEAGGSLALRDLLRALGLASSGGTAFRRCMRNLVRIGAVVKSSAGTGKAVTYSLTRMPRRKPQRAEVGHAHSP